MREDKIKQGITLLSNLKDKNINLEEQRRFLESKMSEEEVTEVFKRMKENPQGASQQQIPSSGGSQPMMVASPHANARMMQTNGHFAPAASGNNGGGGITATSLATVASVAVLSSLGITYMLDNYKNKQDKNLRDEIKDRVQ